MQNVYLLYLDPGTGSLLLYAILGVCTSLLFLFKKLFYLLKNFLLGSKHEEKLNNKYNIVIHSEGGRYFHNFKSVIEEFIKNEKKIVYVTPDKNDPAFSISSPFLEIICFENEYKTISFLNNITANIILSTTPHLDIYMWKKSKKVKKYIHIFHAPTSVDLYEKYALSFYDIILCAVNKTEETQKYLDEKRNLPTKKYYTVGCPYFDNFKNIENTNIKINSQTILYAPSWGKRSSLNTFGKQIIQNLLSANYKVIFRPHPQSFISDKILIDDIKNEYLQNNNFFIDDKKTGLDSMIESDALISDYSGIIFDYYYLIKKPIFISGMNLNINGYEVEDIPLDLQFDIPITKEITYELTQSDINNLPKIINTKMENNNAINSNVELPYFGSAGKQIYAILCEIEKEL